jgi:murein DD-endopeptidase MepM/ murein hydrolase activator NlpD
VRDSQYVNAGEVIAVSGNTGMSTGPHLHLTTKKDGKAFNPTILLDIIRSIKN